MADSIRNYIAQKGFTESECREVAKPAPKEVPAHLKDRFPTYEAYQEAMADFLNGN